jgi:hypothetical protein
MHVITTLRKDTGWRYGKKKTEVNKQEKHENHVTQRFSDAVATDVKETGRELDWTGSGQRPKLGL